MSEATRVAVVTGAARGIGAATARRLHAEGAAVVVADIDGPGAEAVAAELGERALAQSGDVARSEDWDRLRAVVLEHFGRLDVLHSNAFVKLNAAVDVLDEDDWDRQLAVNLKAAYLGVRTFVEELRRSRGCVVVTSSVHALAGVPGAPAYAASKGGLDALVRQLAVDLAPEIRVNAVLPGPIGTAAWGRIDASRREEAAGQTVLGRLGRPEEVAAAVAFLASEAASFITGASLTVDGGWSIRKGSV